jgi:hypothetical protein
MLVTTGRTGHEQWWDQVADTVPWVTRTGVAPIQRYPLIQRPSPQYPLAQWVKLSEQLDGRTVVDPYRWLEGPADPCTVTWTTEQDKLAFAQHTGLDLQAVTR